MIEIIEGLPGNVAAFKATGKVVQEDYDEVVNPLVDKVYKAYGKVNFMLQLETPLSNYSVMAWLKDAILGFVYFTEFNRVAIVSHQPGVKKFTNFFGRFVPGKFRGFLGSEVDDAKSWVSGFDQ